MAFRDFSSPDGTWTGGTTLLVVAGADNVEISTLADVTLSVAFDQDVTRKTVPDTWTLWSSPPNTETETPRVLSHAFPDPGWVRDKLILAFTPAVKTFGVEVCTFVFNEFEVTATFKNGAATVGTVTRSVSTLDPARLFAASTDGQFTSVEIEAPALAQGFGMAQLRYSLSALALGLPSGASHLKGSLFGSTARRDGDALVRRPGN